MSTSRMYRIEPDALNELIQSLQKERYTVIGPTLRGEAIVLDTITSASELPVGKTDEQSPAKYRLVDKAEKTFFGASVGPHSWKQFLFPPTLKIFSARKRGETFEVSEDIESPESSERYAFLGVRACDLSAIQIQDKVFGGGAYRDPAYLRLRHQAFIVAVNCTRAGGTCFCTSLRTGPRARVGFDLAITEVIDHGHYLLVEVGTDKGEAVLSSVTRRPAQDEEIEGAEHAIRAAAQLTGRSLEPDQTREILYSNTEHPRWDVVAQRCLACANCTMVCPTCFCTNVEDVTDLTGSVAQRVRKWDSCFTLDFSYIHGGSVRPSSRARYRHWITHKLASWVDQFGTTGCVGCGRCITWCPVGIDITEEFRVIRETYLLNARGKSST
ncbi:MAG: sulfite reductase subunit A [Ignavibacteria bacterium GWA2_54_16]|nr:MAG: sulfite reductase subunit A [Ignavibacteria bacterium GWA2_54_16]